ncbi:MAG: polysaccharide deacetylase family protein [Dehalococcoidia bacterium]|jgi:peptidoglycan/xylan/chitin deacetylase (PgdA/CDA1 family)
MMTVLSRFGIFSNKYRVLLKKYHELSQELGFSATLPITAVILKRHVRLIKEFQRQGIEFDVHGYIHADYALLPLDYQIKHYKKAIRTFEKHGIHPLGFRAPYLRANVDTLKAVRQVGFQYDSSFPVHWDLIKDDQYSHRCWDEYMNVINYYESEPADKVLVLPRFIHDTLKIPVSLPDDEIIVERLEISNSEEKCKIWEDIVRKSYASGELFTIQLHPERIETCKDALTRAISLARKQDPPIWLASLREINRWWRERSKFTLSITQENEGKYKISAKCSPRGTVVVKNGKVNVPTEEWYEKYRVVSSSEFTIESPKRPAIGVSNTSSTKAILFLQNEGYIVEKSEQPSDYALYLDDLNKFGHEDEKNLVLRIDSSDATLVRCWRWPEKARSAISVTGDIDSITLADFVLRILENSLASRHNKKPKQR